MSVSYVSVCLYFFCCFFFSFTSNSVLHHLRAVEEAPVVRWGAIVGGSADPSICVGHAASCGGRHRSKSNTGRVVAPASIHTPLPATPPQHQPASPHTHATPRVFYFFYFDVWEGVLFIYGWRILFSPQSWALTPGSYFYQGSSGREADSECASELEPGYWDTPGEFEPQLFFKDVHLKSHASERPEMSCQLHYKNWIVRYMYFAL